MDTSISYRPISDEDQEFLCRVYALTRTEELAPLEWPEEQKTSFLRMQFLAQHASYQASFPDASFDIILLNGVMAGRLYLLKNDDEIKIIDIAFLPEFRGRGRGGVILRNIIAEAKDTKRPVRIYVEQYNPAMRLYQRLGFKKTGDTGVYYSMEWLPE